MPQGHDAVLNVDKTTYTVMDFLEWQRQGSLDLQPYYQRRSVWNPRIKSLLIDSILRGFPLPLVFLHNRLDVATSKTIRQVVDGQQRLRTILSFVELESLSNVEEWDRFQVMRSHNKEYAGLGFKQLPEEVQAQVLQTRLSVNVLPADIDDVTVLEVFQRMNSTGLKLNDQEIRNASFFGEFKDCAYALAYSQNQRWVSWGLFSRQDVAQMREVELTSDLAAFLLRGVSARTKAAIDKIYREYDDEFPGREALENEFLDTMNLLEEVYGETASRSDFKRFRTTAWFYVVFAVASGRFGRRFSSRQLVTALERSERDIRSEEVDDELLKTLRGATADKASRTTRIDFLLSHCD